MRQGFVGDEAESRKPFVHSLLGQGRLEQFILDSIHEHSSIKVERGVIAEGLNFNEADQADHSSYPITVQIRTIGSEEKATNGVANGQNGEAETENGVLKGSSNPDSNGVTPHAHSEKEKIEIIKARYLLACDGARSWTREQMGIPMEGSSTDYVWYVHPIAGSLMFGNKLTLSKGSG